MGKQPEPTQATAPTVEEPWVSPAEMGRRLGISLAGVWLMVQNKRIRGPLYPLARSPRWRWADVVADIEKIDQRPTPKLRGQGRKKRQPQEAPIAEAAD